MKIQLETHDWQLLGQIALEISQGKFAKGLALHSLIIWEFYIENIQTFTQPQTRKRKIRNSTIIAIYQYLQQEHPREPLWDIHLQSLKDKLYQKILSIPTFSNLPNLNATV